jgi:uncharacterized membrane protein YdjX (TVP38/TMEM64 family)
MPPEPAPKQKPRLRSRWLERLLALWRGLGPAGPLLLVAAGGPLLGLTALVATASSWLPWFAPGGPVELGVFWISAVVTAACCLAPTHATSLLAGYLFGAWAGVICGFSAVVVAAAVGYALWSRLVGARVLQAIAASDDARGVHAALLGRGFWRTVWLIALLRLSPLMPFAATNLLMASLGVRPVAFLCATAVGIAPRSIGVALVGAQLSELDWRAGGGGWTAWLALAATVAVVFWIGRIAGLALRRQTGAGA